MRESSHKCPVYIPNVELIEQSPTVDFEKVQPPLVRVVTWSSPPSYYYYYYNICVCVHFFLYDMCVCIVIVAVCQPRCYVIYSRIYLVGKIV